MNWKDGISWIGAANFEEHEVNGETVRFYAISVDSLFRLRALGKPLAKVFALLMGEGRADEQTRVYREVDGATEDVIEAVDPELVRTHFSLREDTMAEVIESLTLPKNVRLVGELIMDSMRDDFAEVKDRPPAEEFMKSMDVGTLTQLVEGVIKANGKALEPVVGKTKAPIAQVVGAPETTGETSKT